MSRPQALPCDYDTNPERWTRRPEAAKAAGDVHEIVADRIRQHGSSPVIDFGSGHGRLGDLLGADVPYLGIDRSPCQISRSTQPAALADATQLPIRDESAGAVAALWMLYHLREPVQAIREAHRVLRPGGLFVASTSRRDDSPEVQPPQAPTTFDAEEAPAIVGEVFGKVEMQTWDRPMFTLPDRDSVREYLLSRMADPVLADNVETPVTITKRGCLVWGRKR
jgi:SAM-dependent methyltransferase